MAKIELIQFRLSTDKREKVDKLMEQKGYDKISDFMRHLVEKELEKGVHIKELEYVNFRVSHIIESLKE